MSTALLIVHGIGEQGSGQTTEKLVSGLAAAFGDRLDVQRDAQGHAVGVKVSDISVQFYEVYWASLLSRTANRGLMSSSTLLTLVWQPFLCRHAGLLPAAEYSTPLVAAWLALTLLASLLWYPFMLGARVFVALFDREHQARTNARARGLHFLQRSQVLADAAAHGDTLVEATVEGTVADVPNYMGSVARGEGVAFEVLARFHSAMCDARARHDEVYVLAHSLGTVVAYHALTGLGQPAGEPPYAPRRLFTIGSPLEKIRFYWPWTVRCTSPSIHPEFHWTNFYHRWDAVSGSLRRFEAWAPIDNVRLKGGGGIFRSHVIYEHSPQFLGTLTHELFGERRVPSLTGSQVLKDRAFTTGENLFVPLAVLMPLVLGLGALILVLLGGPMAVWYGMRWFGLDAWADRVAVTLSLFVIVVMGAFYLSDLRGCYRSACANVATAARQSASASGSPSAGV